MALPEKRRRLIRSRGVEQVHVIVPPAEDTSCAAFRAAYRDVKALTAVYSASLKAKSLHNKGERLQWLASVTKLCTPSNNYVTPTEYSNIAQLLKGVSIAHGHAPQRCLAYALMCSAVTTRTVETALGLLVEGTLRNALVPKLRRWFRSRLEEVIKANGTPAMCTLVDIITKLLSASAVANTCPALLEILQEWEVKAAKARGRLPLGQFA